MNKVTENDMIHASTLYAFEVMAHDVLIIDAYTENAHRRYVKRRGNFDGNNVFITFDEGDSMIVPRNHVFTTI